MAPRNYRDNASEPEVKQAASSRSSTKAKNAAAQQAQQEYLSKHINSNGPQDAPKVDPLDFYSFDCKTLDKYVRTYGLNLPPTMTIDGDILQSDIGKKTYSYKHSNKNRVSKLEQSNNVKKHFMNLPCRENEIITNFLYKANNQDTEFKLKFN
ncbi:uncharacterized protein PRCAT00002937001 [Priceomyces carsonii]|uniref:uncharacterized protein n=1 Tax=Priceomyces carsonii TaxID=28549 RepID=UPI002ED957AF|nr:unnamed protein product [Priceomyces carsonii]